jgi:histidine ammonia-lyase
LDLNGFCAIALDGAVFAIPPAELERAAACFHFLEGVARERVIYGINTGFGPLAQRHVAPADAETLQYNLVRSHAAGAGRPLPASVVRAMMLTRVVTFLKGRSGVSTGVIERLCLFLRESIAPEVPEHGGVGASGDLTQQAHLGLALIGEGFCLHNGARRPVADVLRELDLAPVPLKLRDGLAILNGTACMTGLGLITVKHAGQLMDHAIAMGAVLTEIAGTYDDHLSAELNAAKPHPGQNEVARRLRVQLTGSQCIRKREEHSQAPDERHVEGAYTDLVQPLYSIRCLPQLLGPIHDTIRQAESVLLAELHGVDDNPVIDPEQGTVLHGGNFHGDQVALELDKLRLALVKLGLLVERQLNYLMNDALNRRFPPFLSTGKAGLVHGLQGMQYTATSSAAENQALATSLYVHSIPNNNDNQDVVSMGTNAARATAQVVQNTARIMAVQAIALAQAVEIGELRDQLSPSGRAFVDAVREVVPPVGTQALNGITDRVKDTLFIPPLA